jgi:hypothetical protein
MKPQMILWLACFGLFTAFWEITASLVWLCVAAIRYWFITIPVIVAWWVYTSLAPFLATMWIAIGPQVTERFHQLLWGLLLIPIMSAFALFMDRRTGQSRQIVTRTPVKLITYH